MSEELTNTPEDTKSPEGRKPRKKWAGQKGMMQRLKENRAKILEMHVANEPITAIMRETGIPRLSINAVLAEFKPVFTKIEQVAKYRAAKEEILAAGQLQALETAFSPQKLKKASFLHAIRGFEALNKAERLEAGLSTDNHATHITTHKITTELIDADIIDPEKRQDEP